MSGVSDLTRMRELEAENARLKRMYADLALENAAIKDVLAKILTPPAKRQVVSAMVTEHRLPVTRVCRAAGLSRAAYGRRLRQTRAGRWISCTTCSTTAGGSAPST